MKGEGGCQRLLQGDKANWPYLAPTSAAQDIIYDGEYSTSTIEKRGEKRYSRFMMVVFHRSLTLATVTVGADWLMRSTSSLIGYIYYILLYPKGEHNYQYILVCSTEGYRVVRQE